MSLSSMLRNKNGLAGSVLAKSPLLTNTSIDKNSNNDYTFNKPRSSIKNRNYK